MVDCSFVRSVLKSALILDMKKWLILSLSLWLIPQSLLALDETDLQGFINEAIKAGGGEVVVPPGEYLIKNGLVFHNATKIRFVGMDKEQTVLKYALGENRPDDWAMIKIHGNSTELLFRNITFDGDGNNSATALLADHTSKLQVEDCLFQNGFHHALELNKVVDAVVTSCSLRDIQGTGIQINAGSEKNELRGNRLARCKLGIEIKEAANTRIIANELLDCGSEGISVKGDSNTLSDNSIESSGK